jgi:undecaprenyl-diphosphatase
MGESRNPGKPRGKTQLFDFGEHGMKSDTKWLIVSFVAVTLFCIFSFYCLDVSVCWYLKGIKYQLYDPFTAITQFGKSTWYLIVSGFSVIVFKYFWKNSAASLRSLFIFLSISISGIMTSIIKYFLARYRPEMLFQKNLYGFTFFNSDHSLTSFPSGHANTITALMLAMYLFFPRYAVVYVIITFLVSFSRLVLGDHFLSDVVFGWYLAVVTTIYLWRWFERNDIHIFGIKGKYEQHGAPKSVYIGNQRSALDGVLRRSMEGKG